MGDVIDCLLGSVLITNKLKINAKIISTILYSIKNTEYNIVGNSKLIKKKYL